MKKQVGIAEARQNLSRMIEAAHFRETHWIITKSGEPRAILLGFDEYEELASKAATYDEISDPEAVRMDMLADADIKAGRVYTHEEVMAKAREQRRKHS